jgi:glycosyltransferase involved in cell wall biosynthesis
VTLGALWRAYKLRLRRRRLLVRALRKRKELSVGVDRTGAIRPGDILCFVTVRNEADRLPFFLAHYRSLGVAHFLIVDNDSTDGTAALLADQPDISLWTTAASYKAARFGVDWLTGLQMRFADGHWCLTVDADEILIYPFWETRPLCALTELLEAQGHAAFGALTLDMYPKGSVSEPPAQPGPNPFAHLCWFDSGNYSVQVQPRLRTLWIQGGPRARAFFSCTPRKAPTLNKTPLVCWNRRYVYVNSTHTLLPSKLNAVYDTGGDEFVSGVLLHTKFLPSIIDRSRTEKARKEHFQDGAQYEAYYDRLVADPVLHCAASTRYSGWRQLVSLGLMSKGGWM